MEGSAGSTADKKRNKLGYHRTSIACGHCRRRKIRCLLAPNERRCENCIRLKKECQFYTVDQQPPMDKKGRPLSNSDIASADAVLVTTPPLLGPGAAMDQKDSYFPYSNMNPTPDMSPFDPSASISGTAMTTYATDPLMATDLSGVAPLTHAIPFEDPTLFAQQATGVPLESPLTSVPAGAVWSTPLTTASTIASIPNSAIALASPPIPGTNTFVPAQGGQIWNAQQGNPATIPSQTGIGNLQYHRQLSQSANPNFKQQPNALAEVYPNSMGPHAQAVSSSIPGSYGHQQPPVGYTHSTNLGLGPNQGQTAMSANSESVSGFYQPGQVPYNPLKQEGLVHHQGQLLDPAILRNMQKPA